MAKNHDLSLPDWGPYGKSYAGISHIADKDRGLRFDLAVLPSLYRRRVEPPNVSWESSYHPWHSSPNLEFFSFRHQIIWKDQAYADVSSSAIPRVSGRIIRCELVNRTSYPRALALQFMASLCSPSPWINSSASMHRIRPKLPEGSILKHSLEYERLDFAKSEAADCLCTDGTYRGEIRGQDYLDGGALGGRFGRDAGDAVTYSFEVEEVQPRCRLVIHGRSVSTTKQSSFKVSGAGTGEITLNGEFQTVELPVDIQQRGRQVFTLISNGDAQVEVKFVALVPGGAPSVAVQKENWDPHPERLGLKNKNAFILNYAEAPTCYGVGWDATTSEIREIHHDELDVFLRHKTHNHVDEILEGNRRGHFTNAFIRPITVAAGASHVIWGIVCEGGVSTVAGLLEAFSNGAIDRESIYKNASGSKFVFQPVDAGKQYLFSQTRLSTTLLTNTVFPAYIQRQFVKHRTGGRWWDCLYTWDSAFIGLGLLEIDLQQAEECLAQYLTEPGNPHAAFIHHGSMVPVQITLFHEIWNRTRSVAFLQRHYASLRSYYRFYAGHDGGSTTGKAKSGLLRTWDYFYNSGGWDDYPPQKHIHAEGLTGQVCPVINTAMAIRCAKTLASAAKLLGKKADAEFFTRDVERWSKALETYSWDRESGYYGYALHDESGEPNGILRDEDGANFNQGLDGAFPLVAGVCSREQEDTLLSHLFDERKLWTAIGLTAVDQSAAYYRADGYWSGTVWFPHQWYFWKTMLDLGRPDLAWKIASTALEVWREEVEDSYHCFEHFLVETKRGAGWHQFSSLTSPLLAFFASAYCPGQITLGLDAWLVKSEFSENNTRFEGEIQLAPRASGTRSVLVRMNPSDSYRILWNGAPVPAEVYLPGFIGIKLGADGKSGVLVVEPER